MKVVSSGSYTKFIWLSKAEVQYIAMLCIMMCQNHRDRFELGLAVMILEALHSSNDLKHDHLNMLASVAEVMGISYGKLPMLNGKVFGRGKTYEKYVGLTYAERAQLRPFKHAKWVKEIADHLGFTFDPIEHTGSAGTVFEFLCVQAVSGPVPPEIESLLQKNRDAETGKRRKTLQSREVLSAESAVEECVAVGLNPSLANLEQRCVELSTRIKTMTIAHAQAMENLGARHRKDVVALTAKIEKLEAENLNLWRRTPEGEKQVLAFESRSRLRRVA